MNPALLRWARERSGFTLEQVADRLGKAPGEVVEWESGDSAPTYPELEKLAHGVFKRPVAVFFFPAPPEEPTPEKSFRTLAGFEIERLEASTRFRIRQALAKQLALAELFAGKNPVSLPIFPANQPDSRSADERLGR